MLNSSHLKIIMTAKSHNLQIPSSHLLINQAFSNPQNHSTFLHIFYQFPQTLPKSEKKGRIHVLMDQIGLRNDGKTIICIIIHDQVILFV